MIDYKYAELFKQNSADKQISITSADGQIAITNSDIYSEEFELTESLCSESELTFGCCEAGSVKFKVANIFLPMKGRWLTVKTAFGSHTDTPLMLGRYKVYSDVPTADRNWRNIVAYDALYDVINADMTDWYNTILPDKDSKVTLKQFRDSFFKHFGIEQAGITLVNDSMTVEKTVEVTGNSESTSGETMSGREILSCILEINGCFGHMGRDGKFHYIYLEQNIDALYPRNDLYPADNLFPRDQRTTPVSKSIYKSADYEDFIVKGIDKLQICEKENDAGITVGNGGNLYVIQGNFLVYGKSAADLKNIAENIFEKIKDITYRPFSAECLGNPCMETGDAIRLLTRREIIESYILKRTLKGIQALTDTYEAEGEEYRTKNVNSMQRSILQLKGKSNVLERTLEETKSQIVDVENGLQTQIKQNAETITAEVKRAKGIEGELSTAIEVNAKSIQSKVEKDDMGSYITQYYDNVIVAFNKNSKYVQIKAGEINIYNGNVDSDGLRSRFDQGGNHFWRDGYQVGAIGTNQWSGDASHKGLVFDLEYQGKYMAWARQTEQAAGSYTTVLCYSRANSIYSDEGLHLGAHLYGHNFRIYNVDLHDCFANGYSTVKAKKVSIITDIRNGSNGTLEWTKSAVLVRNGMITGAPEGSEDI